MVNSFCSLQLSPFFRKVDLPVNYFSTFFRKVDLPVNYFSPFFWKVDLLVNYLPLLFGKLTSRSTTFHPFFRKVDLLVNYFLPFFRKVDLPVNKCLEIKKAPYNRGFHFIKHYIYLIINTLLVPLCSPCCQRRKYIPSATVLPLVSILFH